MKKIFLFFMLCMATIASYAEVNQTTSKGSRRVIITDLLRSKSHLAQPIDCPDVFYNSTNNQISIDFGNQPIEDYSVTISSPFSDVDYYVTSSYTTIPLVVDGYSDYNIIIATSDGDVFEGTLAASEYASTQMY